MSAPNHNAPHETHVLAAIVENEPGVLARIVGLFTGRGYNIESLSVAEVDAQKQLSRITVVTTGTPHTIQQIKAQFNRIVTVIKVSDLTISGPYVQRELAMIKVVSKGNQRLESLRIADAFRCQVVDSTVESFTFEITGSSRKVTAFIELMHPLGDIEVVRTGAIAIARGADSL